MSKRFRILSLDGGGIKGTFTAAVLAELERTTQKRVADHFDLIAATAAAPTYYSAYRMPGNDAFFIDGGVWANCPVLVAVTEAIAFLDQAAADIDVLSIGTTSYPFQITKQARVGGLMAWSRNILE